MYYGLATRGFFETSESSPPTTWWWWWSFRHSSHMSAFSHNRHFLQRDVYPGKIIVYRKMHTVECANPQCGATVQHTVLIQHRVIKCFREKGHWMVICRGDNNEWDDEPVPLQHVIAIYKRTLTPRWMSFFHVHVMLRFYRWLAMRKIFRVYFNHQLFDEDQLEQWTYSAYLCDKCRDL